MIVPILIGAAALLLLAKPKGSIVLQDPRVWRHRMSEKFKHNTLVGTGTEGLYNVQQVANTTPATTHILNGVFQQGQTVFASPGGELVYFSSDGKPPAVGKWRLYMKPGPIVR